MSLRDQVEGVRGRLKDIEEGEHRLFERLQELDRRLSLRLCPCCCRLTVPALLPGQTFTCACGARVEDRGLRRVG
jgi:hypothetical protein